MVGKDPDPFTYPTKTLKQKQNSPFGSPELSPMSPPDHAMEDHRKRLQPSDFPTDPDDYMYSSSILKRLVQSPFCLSEHAGAFSFCHTCS